MRPLISAILLVLLSFACQANHFTGKKNFNAIPNSQLFPMAFAQYDAFLKEHKVITGTSDARQITRVGEQISRAAQRYFEFKGLPNALKDYRWEYHLVHNAQKNAWCMPGGKIVFYTGILDIANTEAMVAAIMGHEVAHALANHGGQRMSAQLLQKGIGMLGQQVLKKEPQSKQQQILKAYGVATTVGAILPFSRAHESEADKIGLTLMVLAGYPPEAAVRLWERMKAASAGKAPPELLSTHPSNATRIQYLKRWIPQIKLEVEKIKVASR